MQRYPSAGNIEQFITLAQQIALPPLKQQGWLIQHCYCISI